jgi:hypothetical protein
MRAVAVLALALGGCAWGRAAGLPAEPAHAVQPRAEIYQRATNEFTEAWFFKPAEPKTNDLPFTLAPLILQEIRSGKEPRPGSDQFGTLGLSNGAPVLDRSRPAIYWQTDTVQLKGRAHVRLSYLWCYVPAPAEQYRGAEVRPAGLPWQGIRITLNSAGQPAIWEVLADNSGAELIFVSQSLEAAAVAEFGKPLSGRRYAIERRVDEAANVIVARVIDDGPAALGPIVYLSAGTRAASTLICRCMAAQAKQLLGTSTYDLLPFQGTPARSLLTQARALARERTAFWPGDLPSDSRLEHCLRLPSAF